MTGEEQSRQKAAETLSTQEKREDRKSRVRVRLTYAAASFLFGIGLLLIGWFMYRNDVDKALAVFGTVLPTTTFIIGYWFAKRSAEPRSPTNGTTDSGRADALSTTAQDVGEGAQAEAQHEGGGEQKTD